MAEVTNEEAERAMSEFAAVTGQDEIFAQTILQDVNWNLNAALNVYYGNERNVTSANTSDDAGSIKGFEISVMSWNIDGLDGNSLSTRLKAVKKIVSERNADFVFLQEVVERDIDKIMKLESSYSIFFSNRQAQYFTAILTSKAVHVRNHEVIYFANSGMDRTLQIVECSIGPFMVFLLTTHLESTAQFSRQRKEQLNECFNRIKGIASENPDALIFFGGDLNLRDNEISGIPDGFADAWIAAGSPPNEQFTWDTRVNANKQAVDFRGARCRFDRLFYKKGPFNKVDFSLDGKRLIRTCLCHPSDHWAIHASFSID